MADLGVDVVGEDEGEFFAIRPAWPVVGFFGCGWVDGPDVGDGFAFADGDLAAEADLYPAGDHRLECVEDFICQIHFF